MLEIFAKTDDVNLRLDKFLCKKFDISFVLAQKIIREKKVKINNQRQDSAYKIQDQDHIKIFSDLKNRIVKEKKLPKISDEFLKKFFSYVIFEDENILAINKPSGLSVQGRSLNNHSIDDIIYFLNKEKKYDLHLVHRLDRDTSGVLVLAKNKNSAIFLTDCFRNKKAEKTYLALLYGVLNKTEGQINIPLRKKVMGKVEKVYPDFENGKEAITKYKMLKNFGEYCLVELSPITGRTHQLRVHTKEIGHPIVNDFKYGGKKQKIKNIKNRLCLHAAKFFIKDYCGSNLLIEAKNPDF